MMKNNQNMLNRMRRIEGQVRGVRKMIENSQYCVDIITQTSAIKQALSSVENILLESHLSNCVIEQIQNNQTNKAVVEILKVYKLKRK